MRVVECGCEAEERNYSGEFVEEKKGCYVGDGGRGEGVCVFVEEIGEAAVYAGDSRLRGLGCRFIREVSVWWFAEKGSWLERSSSGAEEGASEHEDGVGFGIMASLVHY